MPSLATQDGGSGSAFHKEKEENQPKKACFRLTPVCAMICRKRGVRERLLPPPFFNHNLQKCPSCSLFLRNAGGSVNSRKRLAQLLGASADEGGTWRDQKPPQMVPATRQESTTGFPASFQVSASFWRVPVSLRPQAGEEHIPTVQRSDNY